MSAPAACHFVCFATPAGGGSAALGRPGGGRPLSYRAWEMTVRSINRSSPSTIIENNSSSRWFASAVLRASSGVAFRVDHDEVRFAAGLQVADHALQAQRASCAARVAPPELRGRDAHARLGLPFAAHVVGCQHRREGTETGAPADVARQSVTVADAVRPSKSKKPLPRNKLLVGLTADAVPVSRMRHRSASSKWMQWA